MAAWLQLSLAMLVFRSLTIGLLGACLVLLVGLDDVRTEQVTVHDPTPPTETTETSETTETVTSNVTVIDVAPNVSATTVASLVRLHEGERITAIDDHPIDNDLEAGMEIADRIRSGSKLVDLTVRGDVLRRVLVVLH